MQQILQNKLPILAEFAPDGHAHMLAHQDLAHEQLVPQRVEPLAFEHIAYRFVPTERLVLRERKALRHLAVRHLRDIIAKGQLRACPYGRFV